MKTKKHKFSKTSTMHYIKFIKRIILFVVAAVLYVVDLPGNTDKLFGGLHDHKWFLCLLGTLLLVETVLRLFPSKMESMGCRKHLKKNYRPTGVTEPMLPSWKRTFAVAFCWIAANAVFGVLYYMDVIDAGVLVLISLAYSVGDMVCILFFCPFQTIFLKNKCCNSCRIYNWDFPMMATPLLFIPHPFAGVLVVLSLVVLACWEIPLRLHPERFSERTNACLSCENCEEKLCHHKKQLGFFWKTNKDWFNARRTGIMDTVKEKTSNRKKK